MVNFNEVYHLEMKKQTRTNKEELKSLPIFYFSTMSNANFPNTSKETSMKPSVTEIIR